MRAHGRLGTLAGLLVLVVGCSTKTAPGTLTAAASPGGPAMPSARAAAPLSNASAALEALVAQAKDRNLNPAARVQVTEALGRWATPDVRDPLIELLKDPAPDIRAAAVKGLAWPGNSPVITVLSQIAVDKTEQVKVLAAAIAALIKIGDKSVRPLVLQTSRDPDAQVREEALRGLLGDPLETDSDRLALATRAATDGELSSPFRVEAIKVLAATKDPSVIPTLLKIMETRPATTRLPLLEVPVLRFPQPGNVRAAAAWGLGELGDRSVLPNLVKVTEDPYDYFLRYVAAWVLTGWRECAALPALVKLLVDPVPEVRTVARAGVGAIGDQCAPIGDQSSCQWLDIAYQKQVPLEVRQTLHEARDRLKCL